MTGRRCSELSWAMARRCTLDCGHEDGHTDPNGYVWHVTTPDNGSVEWGPAANATAQGVDNPAGHAPTPHAKGDYPPVTIKE